MSNRYGADRSEYAEVLDGVAAPSYRLGQTWDALYKQRTPLEESTSLPLMLRNSLTREFPLALTEVTRAQDTAGTTVKWLWEVAGGAQVETVLMRYPTRATVCVSSQAGCAMACSFCATGQAGFERHLTSGEIVEQVLRAQHDSPQPVSNVVFMGMGEPLANYDATWHAVERMHADLGISARRLTISTVGITPGMRRLARETLPVTLAVSLHAPDDELRNVLVPVNRRYPLAEVLDAASEFAATRNRRVTFEYACIGNVNDSPAQARALARLLRPLGVLGSHVNLIPLNPTGGYTGARSDPGRLRAFASTLLDNGVNTTIRQTRGTGIDAACGQLRSRPQVS